MTTNDQDIFQEDKPLKDIPLIKENENLPENVNFENQHSLNQHSLNQHSLCSEHVTETENRKRPTEASPLFKQLLATLDTVSSIDDKLKLAIDFMGDALSQPGAPSFKSFWEARGLALALFKENISPLLRLSLWTRYNELSKEAKRLKDILDEESAFSAEQIDIAITALESDIKQCNEAKELNQNSSENDLGIHSEALRSALPFYNGIQRQLNLLNTFATRINALRKELIQREMRIRKKNSLFQRLSAAGDLVFPVRKELIKQVSDTFMIDVDAFINKHFSKETLPNSLFPLREEIKALQNMAKVLTLNTHCFTHTRLRLSQCWDRIKEGEKERKKERSEQKTADKELCEAAMQKLQEFNEKCKSQEVPAEDALKEIDALGEQFRSLAISYGEKQNLKKEWLSIKEPILEQIANQRQILVRQQEEKVNEKMQKAIAFKQEVQQIADTCKTMDPEALNAKRDELLQKIPQLQLNKFEKQEIEKHLRVFKDLIIEKRESALMQLSDDDKESLNQFKEVLAQRKQRRQEIKEQIDHIKKAASVSGLDFEQALGHTAQLNLEKKRLEQINDKVKEVEDKIAEFLQKD